MRHSNSNRKFGRETNQRLALKRSLALSLIKHGKIKTTEAKAKELRSFVEKIITKARLGTLASRRIVKSKLGVDDKKLFDTVAPMYKERKGGYTRVLKLGTRGSDGSPMAIIELV
jgi:large subunit ribosomal protein L17